MLKRAWRRRRVSRLSLSALFIGLVLVLFALVGNLGGKPLPCRPRSLLSQPIHAGGRTCEGAWLTFDFDGARSGVNPEETAITPTTVARLHRLWVHRLPQVSDSAPILLPHLPWLDGTTHDVLYLTTKVGSLVALDASTGKQFWAQTPFTPSDPNKMTTSSPVGDQAWAVVYSYGMDGKVHQYQAITGQEIKEQGWPVPITTMRSEEH